MPIFEKIEIPGVYSNIQIAYARRGVVFVVFDQVLYRKKRLTQVDA